MQNNNNLKGIMFFHSDFLEDRWNNSLISSFIFSLKYHYSHIDNAYSDKSYTKSIQTIQGHQNQID